MTRRSRLGLIVLIAAVIAAVVTGPTGAQESEVQVFTVPGSFFVGVLSPDGTRLAMFEEGNYLGFEMIPEALLIHVLDFATGEVQLVGAAGDYATAAVFTPDGTQLVTLHNNGYLYVRDLATATILKTFGVPYDMTNTMILLPDGKTVATLGGYPEPSVALLDTETGAITAVMNRHTPTIKRRDVTFQNGGVTLAVSPDGRTAAVSTMLDDIWLWDLATGEWSALVDSEEERPMIRIRAMAFTLDGRSLAYHYQEDSAAVHIVDLDSGDEVLTIPNVPAPAFAFSPDGARIAWVDQELTTLYVAPLDQPTAPSAITLPAPPMSDYMARVNPRTTVLAFTPDGGKIVLSGFMSTDGTNAVYLVTVP